MVPSSAEVMLGGRVIKVSRARLGLFLRLERRLREARQAIKNHDVGSLINSIRSYLELAIGEEVDPLDCNWAEFFSAFILLVSLNRIPSHIKALTARDHRRSRPPPWDHPDRTYVLWIHLIATNYGWSREEIENLWPEEAAAFVQEILIDEQTKREWEYFLSPIAHPTDKRGKDMFKPLPRPLWMQEGARVKKMKIPRKLLPSGRIIDLSGVTPEDLDD